MIVKHSRVFIVNKELNDVAVVEQIKFEYSISVEGLVIAQTYWLYCLSYISRSDPCHEEIQPVWST